MNPELLAPRRLNLIWLVLIGATAATWWLGESGASGRGAMVAMLAIAVLKCRLVAWEFMGLKCAGPLWRGLMLGWLSLVATLIALNL